MLHSSCNVQIEHSNDSSVPKGFNIAPQESRATSDTSCLLAGLGTQCCLQPTQQCWPLVWTRLAGALICASDQHVPHMHRSFCTFYPICTCSGKAGINEEKFDSVGAWCSRC